jgi:uncharacterized protein
MPQILNKHHTGEFWRGALYPIGKVGSPVVVGEDLEEVFSSLLQIFNTKRGERVMYPEFGSDLPALLWEPHDDFLLGQIRDGIKRAIAQWEPRVIIMGIAFDVNPRLRNLGILVISIEMRLKNNPRVQTVVKVPISSTGGLFRSG